MPIMHTAAGRQAVRIAVPSLLMLILAILIIVPFCMLIYTAFTDLSPFAHTDQKPSFTLIHRGQKYLVYTSGGAIQMVALRTPRATYWVSNTILNELSNSTMIAIAESLRPLRR